MGGDGVRDEHGLGIVIREELGRWGDWQQGSAGSDSDKLEGQGGQVPVDFATGAISSESASTSGPS